MQKGKIRTRIVFLILLTALTGCGRTGKESGEAEYIEKIEVRDLYGDQSPYEIYGPKESEVSNGYAFWFAHGLTYSAFVCSRADNALVYSHFEDIAGKMEERYLSENAGYTDVEISEVMENGDDRYVTSVAVREDYYGIPYEEKRISYMHLVKEGVGVLWELEMGESSADEETNLVIDELAECYGVNLDILKPSGAWKERNEERLMEEQDIYEPGDDEIALEKVDGYRYLGKATLSVEEEIGDMHGESEVLAPMGRGTCVRKNSVTANMHGIFINSYLNILLYGDLMENVEMDIDAVCDIYAKNDKIMNVHKTKVMPMSGFEEAYYVTLSYEEEDYATGEYLSKTEVRCFIKADDDFCLQYNIKLSENEYDNATNAVLEELETAYGIDFS